MTHRAPERVQALLFDKDGTLFDFHATWSTWASGLLMRLSDGDPRRASDLGRAIGYTLETRQFTPDSLAVAGTPDQLAASLVEHLPNASRNDVLNVINILAADAPMIEAVPLDPLLRRFTENGLRLGVATNDAEVPAHAHLDGARIRHHFDFVAGFDSGYGAKPQPGQLIAFCNAVSVSPRQVVMVGDSTHDLVAGQAAGMWTVGVLTGLAGRDELAGYADVVLPDIGHLPDWLGLP